MYSTGVPTDKTYLNNGCVNAGDVFSLRFLLVIFFVFGIFEFDRKLSKLFMIYVVLDLVQ